MDKNQAPPEQRSYWRHEKIAFLALSSIEGIGFWTLHKIASAGLGFNNALRNPSDELIQAIYSGALEETQPPNLESAQEKLWLKGLELARQLKESGATLVFKHEDGFPLKLRATKDSPEWIFIQGNPHCLYEYSIAIVGTRDATEDGALLTRILVSALSESNIATISGLAAGIDQLAHLESIRYGIKTIAVLGTGIFLNYPKGSEKVRQRIIESGGCIVSEYLPHQRSSAETFVRRNRIQAALCDTLIPVEWKIKSGTAHTVGFAKKYNKNIANIFLPQTYHLRPELAFSEKEYEALSFEMPINIASLISFAFTPKETIQKQLI
ncbi:DNA-processing protein DprA [Pseudomonas sp. SCA2728.1_7]|uniref:DNA-processing protein DprA n=1 Tax=Pseudomonas sp. SCA2728.1_7 TaxID=2825975 RepID=UPI001BAE6E7C|nr:DNA-processing protein DprA [Pseudomonas sp. SCA2728.1_7]QUE90449.1 DNA-protecting protein DprA [Pseudomonas sp. SCA2728.1_7]